MGSFMEQQQFTVEVEVEVERYLFGKKRIYNLGIDIP